MIHRRNLLIGGVGAGLLAALGFRVWDRGVFSAGKGLAFEAWRQWQGNSGEGVIRPLHAAILASNAHDSQPWIFEPAGDEITLLADRARNLGSSDPFRREMYLSLGCALANLEIAARHFGYDADISFVPGRLEPSQRTAPLKAAAIALRPRESRTAAPGGDLFAAIPVRHTNRCAYQQGRKVPHAVQAALFGSFGGDVQIVAATGKDVRDTVSSIVMDATGYFIADKEMSADSGRWFRTGARDIRAHRDGVILDAAGLSPTIAAIAKILPDPSVASANRYWLQSTRDVQLPTAAAFGIVLVRDRMDAAQALAAGRAWQIFQLGAAARGLSAQPLNQPVEMADRNLVLGRQDAYKQALAEIAGLKDWDPTFVFRIGYAERAAALSPRRHFEDVVRIRNFA
jgi:nitroreductase